MVQMTVSTTAKDVKRPEFFWYKKIFLKQELCIIAINSDHVDTGVAEKKL